MKRSIPIVSFSMPTLTTAHRYVRAGAATPRWQLRRQSLLELTATATAATSRLPPTHQFSSKRTFAIYAVGEGWTGALTRKYLPTTIPGHFDEDSGGDSNDGLLPWMDTSFSATTTSAKSSSTVATKTTSTNTMPVLIYPHDDIHQVTVGWGTTAILNTQGRVQLVGRPHDVMTLLRLNRLPKWVRQWVVTRGRRNGTDDVDDAVTPVGTAISNIIGWATGTGDAAAENTTITTDEWEHAKKYSYLADWTYLDDNNSNISNGRMKHIACGPGFVAMIEREGGTLYTMGVNNRGQCGVGTITNNVWKPQPVRGLTRKKTAINDKTVQTEQEEPIVQVALGFQHGYALSKEGQVYSWGKAQRGQLGRKIDFDQDPWAGPILMHDEKVVQVSAGHHHGALLTEHGTVYVWGKNMGRSSVVEGEDNDKPKDALKPELVTGLPNNAKVQQISCGSHHTSMLLQDGSVYAIGIASDEAVPILNAVELIPPGILELPVRQFEAHFDRTTVVDKFGTTVLQAHLWLDETLREYAYFTPSYVDALLDNYEDDNTSGNSHTIRSIHRGWRHTVIVTGESK